MNEVNQANNDVRVLISDGNHDVCEFGKGEVTIK